MSYTGALGTIVAVALSDWGPNKGAKEEDAAMLDDSSYDTSSAKSQCVREVQSSTPSLNLIARPCGPPSWRLH